MVNDWFSSLALRAVAATTDGDILLPMIAPRFAPTRGAQPLTDAPFWEQDDDNDAPARAIALPPSPRYDAPTTPRRAAPPVDDPLAPTEQRADAPASAVALPSTPRFATPRRAAPPVDDPFAEAERPQEPPPPTRRESATRHESSREVAPPTQLTLQPRLDVTLPALPDDRHETQAPLLSSTASQPRTSSSLPVERVEHDDDTRPPELRATPPASSARSAEPPLLMPLARPALPPASRAAATESAPTVTISIGRIDIRAQTPPSTPTQRPTTKQPTSLDEYLRQRRGGRER